MPVFDFKNVSNEKKDPVCTYQVQYSDEHSSSMESPILVIDNRKKEWEYHTEGMFTNFNRRSAFEFKVGGETVEADILSIDSRFVSLIRWLGENRVNVRLSGKNTTEGYVVLKVREMAFGGGNKLSAQDGFLQFMIGRLLESNAVSEEVLEEEELEKQELGDAMRLTSVQSITDFLKCAGKTLPENIHIWAGRNLNVVHSQEVTQEERRHAQRALSIMLNIQWKNDYFESIDPVEARRILDEELYGLESVKQRIIETIIQINRTHTLPAYGLLLCGPAGTGKSQVAYAVARILKLPWSTLDMSSIHDPEQLTGSSRVYANAKPGIIMEAFAMAGTSNLVFIINELDKANDGKGHGNPADVLLTLLDNLGFTDNYMECTIPTTGVYPIATANDKSRISAPLMSRFAVIDIPDYTAEEKKVIFQEFALPKILKRMGMTPDECQVTEDGLEELVKIYTSTTGVRDIEQAAEHLAANALYQIEVNHVKQVTFDAAAIRKLEH
ncbi:MAG: AAA family ATPase [Lachnospiraceae bacterium]|nr:AAA family ATPase [Lachnospiraceae bacterium]